MNIKQIYFLIFISLFAYCKSSDVAILVTFGVALSSFGIWGCIYNYKYVLEAQTYENDAESRRKIEQEKMAHEQNRLNADQVFTQNQRTSQDDKMNILIDRLVKVLENSNTGHLQVVDNSRSREEIPLEISTRMTIIKFCESIKASMDFDSCLSTVTTGDGMLNNGRVQKM